MSNKKLTAKQPPAKQPVLGMQDGPDIRPSMGYTPRININEIVNDPANSHLAFRVVNNELGQMPKFLKLGWRVWQEEQAVNYDFNPDEPEDQVNRAKKGAACYPVGKGKSGTAVDAYLLYCSKQSYEKALIEAEKQAVDQIELVHKGKIHEEKQKALQGAIGGKDNVTASVMEETSFTNTIAST